MAALFVWIEPRVKKVVWSSWSGGAAETSARPVRRQREKHGARTSSLKQRERLVEPRSGFAIQGNAVTLWEAVRQ